MDRRFLTRSRGLDAVLAGLVLLLAFLLACFPARNADVWMHLAAGRLLAHGEYTFGVDPFAYTTAGEYWANLSWLFQWVLYVVTSWTGGPEGFGGNLAVALKALALTGLAGIMLSIHRPGLGLLAPAVCNAIALVAMSPRFTLQPEMASLLFLGMTLWLLRREGKPEPTGETRGLGLLRTASPRRLYALPLLFFIWVNFDGWFLLGPLAVGLSLLGEVLQAKWTPVHTGPDVSDPAERRTLGRVLVLGLAACLVNPHHIYAYRVPVEGFFSPGSPALRDDPMFAQLFTGPFDLAYFRMELTPAGLAYFPLLGLGLGSFVLNVNGWRWWRAAVFGGFCLLSLWNMRLIPYFAVVAGPIAALNVQDFTAQQLSSFTNSAAGRRWSLIGRGAAVVAVVSLLAAAWPGWLQGSRARRTGWGIWADPSLVAAAGQLRQWRDEGRLPPGSHAFSNHPDFPSYCAWFFSEEKGFFDYRIGLFRPVSANFEQLCQTFIPDAQSEASDWQRTLRRWGVSHVVLHGPNASQTASGVSRFLNDPRWTLLYFDGRTTIFGWNDAADRWSRARLDLDARAFGAEASAAPPAGPGWLKPPGAWREFWSGSARRPLDIDEAEMDLVFHEAVRRQRQAAADRRVLLLLGLAGAVQPLELTGRLPVVLHEMSRRLSEAATGPILAVRAARRAASEGPGNVFLSLARAYDSLENWEDQTASRSASRSLTPGQVVKLWKEREKRPAFDGALSSWVARTHSPGQLLRRIQLVTAMQQHLALHPDDRSTHGKLHELYWGMNYFDLALDHLRAEVALLRGEKGMDQALEIREKFLQEREKEVEGLRREYVLAAAKLPLPQQAFRAFYPFGLAGEALTVLQQAGDLGQREAGELLFYLLLTTGKAHEFQALLARTPALPGRLDYYQALAEAALGNYGSADRHLEAALAQLPAPGGVPLLLFLQAQTLGESQSIPIMARVAMLPILQSQAMQSGLVLLQAVRRQGELRFLRGMLALEQGDVAAARRHFQSALAIVVPRRDFDYLVLSGYYLGALGGR